MESECIVWCLEECNWTKARRLPQTHSPHTRKVRADYLQPSGPRASTLIVNCSFGRLGTARVIK